MAATAAPSGPLYERLDPARQEIRLLTVQFGAVEDQTRCDIEVLPLQEDPDFVALCYVWGEARDRRDILVRGNVVRVTTNLDPSAPAHPSLNILLSSAHISPY